MSFALGIFWALLLAGVLILPVLIARKGWLVITIFAGWQWLFGILGWISAYYLAEDVYVLKGKVDLLQPIAPLIAGMFVITLVLAILSPKANGGRIDQSGLNTVLVRNRGFFAVLEKVAIAFSILLLVTVDISNAPLFNWWHSNSAELLAARVAFYQESSVMSALGVVRYLFQYALFPLLAFGRGIGLRVSWWSILLFVVIGLLTLAKTAFVFIVLGYVFGRAIRQQSVLPFIKGVVVITVAFVGIVAATYFLEGNRSLLDILYVFYLRLIVIPVSISAEYASIYAYSDGMRSSEWYVMFFGGEFTRLDLMACQINQGHECTMVSGIFGSLYPNVPDYLHWPYILAICFFVWGVSVFTASISRQLFRLLMTFFLGLSSAFFLLTDPLVALNTYGFLWGTLIIFLYFVHKTFRTTCQQYTHV